MTPTEEEKAFAPIGACTGGADYRGALVMIEDFKGRLLLQMRDRNAPVHPGEWGLFGGGVEPGETLAQAASREVREEIGVEIGEVDGVIRVISPLAGSPAARAGIRSGDVWWCQGYSEPGAGSASGTSARYGRGCWREPMRARASASPARLPTMP